MNSVSIYKSAEGQRAVMALYDRTLKEWPVPCETLNLETRHGRTFIIASGEKSSPPLVLLHGAASNALAWMGDVTELSQSCRVLAVDLPGEPGKSSPNRPSWKGLAYVEWLEDVLNALEIQSASVLGISQGGWTALRFATARPERVERLVLLAPGGIVPARLSFVARAVLFSMLGRRGAEAINRMVFGRDPIAEEAVQFMNLIMTHFKPRIGALPMFTDEELRRLTMPTLLIAGERDAIIDTAKTAARLRRLVPNLTAVILPEVGHVLHGRTERVVPFLTAADSPCLASGAVLT